MIRNKLYDEVEAQGYTFQKIMVNNQPVPYVYRIEDLDDWAMINTTVMINGQYQVDHGSAVTETTVRLLQRILEETSKPDYYDFISKNCLKDGE